MSASRQECVNEFANQVLQSRLVAAVPTWGNGEAPSRNAHNQSSRLIALGKVAAKAWAKRSGKKDAPTPTEELQFSKDIASVIVEASRLQVQIDEQTELLICGGSA